MAKLLLAIGGRVEAGEVLSATIFNTATGTSALTGFTLQWQVWNGSTWSNVGAANALTLSIPNNSSVVGLAYRLVSAPASQANEATTSAATSAAIQDKSGSRAPTLTDVATSLTVAENAPATLLDGAVTFNDQDNSAYGGGSLTILNTNSLAAGGDGQDVLSVRNQGTGAGQVSFNAATGQVYYSTTAGSPVLIGQVDAVLQGNGTDLRIAFHANATKAMVDKLVENIVFSNNDNSPTTARLLTIKVADGTGGTVQRAMQVNVTASADAPVITSAAAIAVNENQTAAGTVTALDPDREAAAAQGITYSLAAGAGATDNALVTINPATGALSFNTAPDREGSHSPTYLVRVRATDSGGLTAEQAITITVNNVNEAPFATDLAASTTENGAAIEIAASQSDPEGGSLAVTLDTAGTVGTASFDAATGRFTYDTAGRFEFLPAGGTATDTFAYTVTDAGGLSVTRSVTVTVQGANDAPTLEGESAHTVLQGPLLGNVFATDIDGDALSFSGDVQGAWGTFTIDPATGAWVYLPDPAAVSALGLGQQATETITVTATDAYGAHSRMGLSITVVGANDAPRIAGGIASGMVAEDGTPTAQGRLTATDADTDDTLAWSGNAAGIHGGFAIDPATGAWTYTLDNQATATQMLGQGESVTERFTVTLTDSQGATAQQEVNIIVEGANDGPFVQGQAAHTLGGNTWPDLQGTLSAGDIDGDAVTFSGAAQGAYGAFSIVPATGEWTYVPNVAAAVALGQGRQAVETFTVTVTDASGASAQMEVDITLVGANEAPTAAGGTASGEVAEDGVLSAQGQLFALDVDAGDSLTWSGGGTGVYGSFTVDAGGSWTYWVDNAGAAVQALPAGARATESFVASVTDAWGAQAQQTVTITVGGTNDAPTVTGIAGGQVSEAGAASPGVFVAQGSLSAVDPDAGDTATFSGSAAGVYGNFAIDAGGDWTYTLDNARSAAQALRAGQAVTETFIVTVADASGATARQPVSITVTGSNDGPVVSASSMGTGTVNAEAASSEDGQVWMKQGATYNWQMLPGFATAMDASGRILTLNRDDSGQIHFTRINADGSPDMAFGGDGSPFVGGSWVENMEVAVHAGTGKIAVVGNQWNSNMHDFVVQQFLADGTPDTSFGFGGSAWIDLGNSEQARSVSYDSAGRIVVTGVSNGAPVATRLTASGSLDTSFGIGGKWTFTGENDGAWLDYHKVAIDAVGRLWVWGHTLDPNTNMLELRVFRYTAAGNADTTFATGGEYQFNNNKYTDYDLAIAPDGGFAFAWVEQQFQTMPAVLNVIRFGPNGTPLAGFGTSQGKVSYTIGDYTHDVTVEFDGQGRVLIGAATAGADPDMMVLRLTTSGARDSSFGVNGVASGDFGDRFDHASELHIAPNGDIVAVGLSTDASGGDRMIAFQGFTATGAVDTGFGGVVDDRVGGRLVATDPDSTGTLTWAGSGMGAFGALSLAASGDWVYVLDNDAAATQALLPGQTATDRFDVTVTDTAGAATLHQVVITVVGSPAV